MDERGKGGSALLIDRLTGEAILPPVDLAAATVPPGPEDRLGFEHPAPPVGSNPLLRSPGLAAVAVALVVEGYRWLDVITPGHSWFLSLAFGGAGTTLFAALVVVSAVTLTRHSPGITRSTIQRLMIAGAGAVTAATFAWLVTGGPSAATVLGVVDLAAAASAAAALGANEWGGRWTGARAAGPARAASVGPAPSGSTRSGPVRRRLGPLR